MTAEAGVSYAQSCLESASDPTSAWSSDLKPNTDCTGTPDSSSAYVQDQTDPKSPRYRTSFAVQPVATGSDNIPKAKTVGTVEVLAASSGTVTKTYTSETTVILNVGGGGGNSNSGGLFDNLELGSDSYDGRYCDVRSDQQLWCRKIYGAPKASTKFKLPSGVTVKEVGHDGGGIVCVLGSDNLLYCVGNPRRQFATGNATGTAPYPTSTPPVPFSTSAGNPLPIKSIFGTGGVNGGLVQTQDGNSLCVLALDDKMYCAGVNSEGQFGNNTTTASSYAVPAFNTGQYLSDPSIKIQSIVTFQPRAVVGNLENGRSSPGVFNSGICVIAGTTPTTSQLYCAGYCGLSTPFGTTLLGSGIGCGDVANQYYGGASTAYNVAPFDCSGFEYKECYKTPVKFIIPTAAGYVTAANYVKLASFALCVKASDGRAYCTGQFNTTSYGPIASTIYEPTKYE